MMEERDVIPSDREESGSTVVLRNRRKNTLELSHRIREGSSKKVMQLVAQAKCLYTNVCNTANKQEMEAMVQSENYDLIAIMETWWD